MKSLLLPLVLLVPAAGFAAPKSLTVTAANKLDFARPSQTIELTADQLSPLGARSLDLVHVKDSDGRELVCQAVDEDYDAYHRPDAVIFQADFAPGQSRTFTVTLGKKQEYPLSAYKAYGRFVRERFDDFAWENDRIAHRTYGKALETWEGEPLSSSAIDIWSKRTPRLVINEWYLCENYHQDSGDGFDNYSAGRSRGDGGIGFWADGRLWTSRNFVDSRVLTNGPIRVTFELVYEPFDVNGISVAEVKRVSLDAGQNLDHYQSTFKVYSRPDRPAPVLTPAIGLKQAHGETVELDEKAGSLVAWEPMESRDAGMQGLALVFPPSAFQGQQTDDLNHLVLLGMPADHVVDYWAGFFWEKTGQFAGEDRWKQYVSDFAKELASPIEVSVSAQ